MRKFYAMLLLLCSVCMFVACSDDDDKDDGNGKGAGNGGSGVEVLAKKVTQVKKYYGQDVSNADIYTFDYDAEGRLYKFSTGSDEITTITYAGDKITCTEGTQTSTITLKDGKAEKEESYYSSMGREIYTFTYSGDYLATCKWKSERKEGEVWKEEDNSSSTTFTVKDRLLVSSRYVETYNNREDVILTTYEYSPKINNNTNVDFLALLTDEEMGNMASILCVVGKRFANLPTKIIVKGADGELYVTTTLVYTVDKEGYITKIVVTEVEEDQVSGGDEVDGPTIASTKAYQSVKTFEITYK